MCIRDRQMMAWGMVGLVAGLIGRLRQEPSIPLVMASGLLLSLMFDVIMNLSSWILFYGLDPTKFLATYVAALPFTVAHMASTAVFTALLARSVLFNLRRFKDRFTVEYVDTVPLDTPA